MRLDRRLLLAGLGSLLGLRPARAVAEGPPEPAPHEAIRALPRTLPGADLQVIDLWPGEPPGGGSGPDAEGFRYVEGAVGDITRVARPCLLVMRPVNANGAAMIVAAGGGYEFIAIGNEGVPVGRVLKAAGITVFLLIYRLPAEGWGSGPDAPRQDAQRAIRLVRARGTEFGIDPARVGVLGFSAGGHLMGETAVGSARNLYDPVDATDAQPVRPALAGLIYPVITMRKPFDRTHTRRILVGDEVTEAEMKTYSVDLQVGPETPPTFLAQAIDDPVAVADHPLLMFAALRKARVPAELHLFERGGHGFGLGLPGTPAAAWSGLFLAWIRLHDFLRR
ncbi:Acetyl esterase/lipase [Methylobacterium phyllostachyos]|uniref:Acetyl esterase/lipase n=1 Tax=Methylobacterium phyllostachyos TaxID=582672 RepID=A0A1G9VLG0_9HYPH|nr:alpha/beta hydrolase [Methylobacterium phyllostachyos]SDM72861.1 Acetyl esterase/lipase [Methylobacterium phyllostachyos]